ncbi:Alpha-D-ribose 1-methylphosphonate 5-triphosphate synthase subunit PhnG [Andreprevotia sp. IGB-42]|uniref:phosphonate C-P lyase system protein PhnG n=1 Tax=Andreprevotia sp. IGB-42 TaxID=2497473 RepID=UPI0013568C81|nr:phosphonate C-P lyase system protein PhnG [Andreprevotia sp. IGB-42]KAF0813868.1 Alpha-D-ribose 1-methylphosphonate 5-triphosphate synthase subunit PhnG [Andreprevotia sp. IGB-42]
MSEQSGNREVAAQAARQRWLAVLARAGVAELETQLARHALPALSWLRRPESGLMMVRARAGGTGQQYNQGEVSVTRCAVQDETGRLGVGYVQGRDSRHAELVALFDLLLQDETRQADLLPGLIAPLAARQAAARDKASAQAAATRVNFFTLARGD